MSWGDMLATMIEFINSNRIVIGFGLAVIYLMYVGYEYLLERSNEHEPIKEQ